MIESMTLASAINKAFDSVGVDCIETTIMNIVADYDGYKQVPAAKQILKEFVSLGYGEKVLELYTKKLPWKNKMKSFTSEFSGRTGFRKDLVKYVFECIEFGLGWLESEPTYVQDGSLEAKKDLTEDLTGLDPDKQLILLQKEYISMLNSLIVVPKGKLYKKSGYYPAQAISELWVVEHKIDIISADLGQDNSAWCKTEKEKVLLQYQQTKTNQIGAVFAKLVLPLIVLIVGIIEGIMYSSSSSELKEYDSFMTVGDDALADGNYEDAIAVFGNAANEYNGSFAKSSKIKKANAKQIEAVKPLLNNTITNAKELASLGKYADAKALLIKMEQYPMTDAMRSSLVIEQSNLDELITKAISDGKNTILMVISTKGPKLDAATRETLDELLKVAPNDYWLNFVLNKAK